MRSRFLIFVLMLQLAVGLFPLVGFAQSSDQQSIQEMASLISSLQSIFNSLKAKVSAFKGEAQVPAVQAQTADITAGLIGHWKFDEGSGTTAADASGNNNAGTLTNNPTWVAGKLGQALSFDGVDDRVSVANESNFDFVSNFSVSIWMKTSLLGYDGIVGKFAIGSGWDLGVSSGKARMTLRGSSQIDNTGNITISDDIWHHIVAVNTPSSVMLYIDGVLDKQLSGTWTAVTNNNAVIIGNRNTSSASHFNGLIDEVRVYNRALNAAEIQQLYTGSLLPDVTPPAVPTNLTSSGVTSSQVSLSWGTSVDPVVSGQLTSGLAGYRVYRCQGSGCTPSVQLSVVTGTSYQDNGLLPGTAYGYRVAAHDAAGNVSAQSTTLSLTTASVSQSLPATIEMSFSSGPLNTFSHNTPIVTFRGSIYMAWIDNQGRAMIAKKSPNGTIQTQVVMAQVDNDVAHTAPSIGVDKNGYIHYAANMHHSPYNHAANGNPWYQYAWQYLVSDQPEDISSWTFKGNTPQTPPGTWITYPFFAADNNGELYVSYRHRVNMSLGWEPGIMAGAIAKYDTATKTWTARGGTNYIHGVQTVFWAEPNPNTAIENTYQAFKITMVFDRNNRLHVVTTLHRNALLANGLSPGMAIVYAWSDDGGATFHRSNGSLYDLPVRFGNADFVVDAPWTDQYLVNSSNLTLTSDQQPIISFVVSNQPNQRFFVTQTSTGTWSAPLLVPLGFNAMVTADPCGYISGADYNNVLRRTRDNGATWQSYNVGILLPNFDPNNRRVCNILRYQESDFSTWARAVTISLPGSLALIGDLNLDRIVNSLDWGIMNNAWATKNAIPDLTYDGIINSLDFSLLNANWGRTL